MYAWCVCACVYVWFRGLKELATCRWGVFFERYKLECYYWCSVALVRRAMLLWEVSYSTVTGPVCIASVLDCFACAGQGREVQLRFSDIVGLFVFASGQTALQNEA